MKMDVPKSSEETRKRVIEDFGLTIKEAEEQILEIQAWARAKEDLPELPSQRMIERFLIMNKFKTETTKRKLEMYYNIRNEIPEFFRGKHPSLPNMEEVRRVMYSFFLPQLTPDLNRVSILKFSDTDPKNLNPNDFSAHLMNCHELTLIDDINAAGEVFIINLEGASFRHLLYFGVGTIRKLSRATQEVYASRIKQIHFLNCPSFFGTLFAILKAVLKPKLVKRIHIHNSFDTLLDFFPKDILPKEFGGEGESLDKLNELSSQKLLKYKDRFDKLDQIFSYN